jgi:DNA adenine methylase
MAARFITLNKTCYNGLYRVNKGILMSFGKYKKPKICDERNIINISNLLIEQKL